MDKKINIDTPFKSRILGFWHVLDQEVIKFTVEVCSKLLVFFMPYSQDDRKTNIGYITNDVLAGMVSVVRAWPEH